ncbi:unnamed protein product [Ambrosiozyma monospora]|uniref:Unnamed protein product n=1 Tax=Ambrosiozyma monospora TaxID=43982 RepID=A0ACB5U159_AMBMO|nr:unnamed protein product [Ambrosiozyma monospora]
MVIKDLLYYSIDINCFVANPLDFYSGPTMVDQLVRMIGYNDMFDEVISMVIQDLNFCSTIFESYNYDQFANSVFPKSIKLKSICIKLALDNPEYYSMPNILKLLDCHCSKVFYLPDCEDGTNGDFHRHIYYLKFTTSLTFNDGLWRDLSANFLAHLDRSSTLTLKLSLPNNITNLKRTLQSTSKKFRQSGGNLIVRFFPFNIPEQEALDLVTQLNNTLESHRNLNIVLRIDWNYLLNSAALDAHIVK